MKKKPSRSKAEATVDISLLLPTDLIATIKNTATKAGLPYQRFIRQTLESAVQPRGKA